MPPPASDDRSPRFILTACTPDNGPRSTKDADGKEIRLAISQRVHVQHSADVMKAVGSILAALASHGREYSAEDFETHTVYDESAMSWRTAIYFGPGVPMPEGRVDLPKFLAQPA